MTRVTEVFVLCSESQEVVNNVGGIIGRVVPGLWQTSCIRIVILYRKSMVLSGV